MRMNKRELLWRFGLPAAVMLGGLLLGLGAGLLADRIELRNAEMSPALPAEEPAEGIGRVPAVIRYNAGAAGEEIPSLPAYDEYTEGEGPAPAWYDPDEPMAAEWEDSKSDPTQIQPESNPIQRTDAGCPDWNLESSLTGWDGRRAEIWEMDLYARIMYLEFWGTSPECCEAGADSVLRLWESGYFGSTLGGVLSAVTETGAYCYSTYPAVWATEYDPDGLAEMRALCAERFYNGPEWDAAFFQLGGFPEWACPMYELDGVYFSTGKGWQ